MTGGDSEEVQEFLSALGRVKEACDDEPSNLPRDARNDAGLRELCTALWHSALHLEYSEKKQRRLFTAPANLSFIKAWRDYEERYNRPLAEIAFWGIFDDLEVNPDSKPTPSLQTEWEWAEDNAREEAHAIKGLIEYARNSYESGLGDDRFDDGLRAWDSLVSEAGLDISGILRRRELVPFILIPRHVAARESGEASSLFGVLQQAQDAFILGTPFAAIALMRSVMEAVLRDHYGAKKEKLEQQIDEVAPRLPKQVFPGRLHQLRMLANRVVHSKLTEAERKKLQLTKIELEIVSLLLLLRALIEGAPTRGRN